MTILVTGGAGFIGSHLCDSLLAQGHAVAAIDDLSSGRLANIGEARTYGDRFTFYSLDIRVEGLPALFERHRPEVVMHLAALRESAPAPDAPAEAGVGLMGLLAVLECSVGAGASKVVFASSASMYGEPRGVPIKESTLPAARPLTPAAISKRVAEDYLRFYQGSRGLNFTSLILPNVFGPRQVEDAGVVAAFAGRMLDGERPEVSGDGEQTRDFLFIDDAVHALTLGMEPGSGRTMNVGTGRETSVNDVFRMLAEITGFEGEPLFGPSRPGDIRRSALDSSLAAKHLGWKPWTHLEDGLRETVAYLRTS
ncbi:MAG TPA: NAD-dependent epimerase/dehydratase family protein [Actinomycetota bacterium]